MSVLDEETNRQFLISKEHTLDHLLLALCIRPYTSSSLQVGLRDNSKAMENSSERKIEIFFDQMKKTWGRGLFTGELPRPTDSQAHQDSTQILISSNPIPWRLSAIWKAFFLVEKFRWDSLGYRYGQAILRRLKNTHNSPWSALRWKLWHCVFI